MSNKLSHSSTNRFMQCPKSFDFWYNQRLRPTTTSGALLFGTAVDLGIQELLKTNDLNKAKQVFLNNWEYAEINKKKENIRTSLNVVYSDNDGDTDLFLFHTNSSEHEDLITTVCKRKKEIGWANLTKEEQETFNWYNWTCLESKGYLMLEAIKNKIIPRIKEVLAIQVPVELTNQQGDSVIGYADLVCRFDDIKEPIVFDFKTSSIEYKADSVATSPQLTLYVHALSSQYENTRKAGFIVMSKRIHKNKKKQCSYCGKNGTGQRHKTCDAEIDGKRCGGQWIEKISPECWVDVIVDEISMNTEDLVIENIDYINQAIKNGVFTRNLQSCVQNWGLCSFHKLCHKGSKEGLEIV